MSLPPDPLPLTVKTQVWEVRVKGKEKKKVVRRGGGRGIQKKV